jgi:regulator of protease activity HflC (stomatin/prohibitin superfamily)
MSKSSANRQVQFGLAGCVTMLVLVGLVGWEAFHWTVNRVYVKEGESAYLRYKGPLIFGSRKMAASGQFAQEGEIGVREKMLGPGRHFYCPIWWEVKVEPDKIVKPGEVGIVTSKFGENLPAGHFLVEGELGQTKHRGILRKVYGPGRYRVHPYAYEFEVKSTVEVSAGGQMKHSGFVNIPTGYVGVLTNLTDNPLTGATAGIQDDVLQPGMYLLNPKEQVVDVVLVGYYEKSIATNLQTDAAGRLKLDASGEPMIATDDSGISFPSKDSQTIHIDFTAIWGVMPDQAPKVIFNFGTLEAVETKIIEPQIQSICRIQGSQFGSAELLEGETRERFQAATSRAFQTALKDKHITLLNGLVRYIHIPRQIREPIQKANLANEFKLTSEQKELTAKTEGLLREAEKNVELAIETVKVETDKMVAKVKADGDKTAAETRGETVKLVAEIDRKTAELESQAMILIAEATSQSKQLLEKAKAGKFKLAVDAFGSGDAYNQWVFASGLPEDIKLNLLYAGQGTFWTDLKGFSDVMLSRQVQLPPTQAPAKPPATQPQR